MGALGECRRAHLVEHAVHGPQLVARIDATTLAAQAFAIQQVRPGERRTDAGAAESLDRLAVQAFGGLAFGDFRVVYTNLVVNRRTLRVRLHDHGHQIFAARVGVGTPSTPSPASNSWVREKFHVAGNPLYGVRAIGTATYSGTLPTGPAAGSSGCTARPSPASSPAVRRTATSGGGTATSSASTRSRRSASPCSSRRRRAWPQLESQAGTGDRRPLPACADDTPIRPSRPRIGQ
jgi:hypothetical protein